MKYLMSLLLGAFLLLSSGPAMADQAEDAAAIRKVREKRIATYNTKNLALVEETIAEDAEDWLGEAKGRDAGKRAIAELFEGRWKNLRITQLEEIGIIFVTPDVAIFKSRQEYSGMVDEEGRAITAYQALFAEVYVKRDGKWLAHSWYWRPTRD
jgi:uncharacterized protein (TIGR02246 family)